MNEDGKWSVKTASNMITRNGGSIAGKGIYHPQPGIKVLGAIDFLVNHAGFHRQLEY